MKILKAKAQLMTNSCDAVRKKNLLFSAMLPIEEYSEFDLNSIKKNLIYELIYYPDNRLTESVVDLGIVTTISRELFEVLLKTGKVEKIASLSDIGYYLWLSKMTVYLLRPESAEVIREKKTP